MPNTFYVKAGDTAPAIETILSDALGPVDLTGCTVIFRMSPDGGGNPLLEESATIVTPQTGADKGKVNYQWQTGDTDTPSTNKAEWKVTFPDGTIATFPRGSGDLYDIVEIQDVVS
jgi:hypothetical protein